jgi:hypothetical protein
MAEIPSDFGLGGSGHAPRGGTGSPTTVEILNDIADDLADAIGTAPAALTSPAAGLGSGADATTFNGAECDALRADVAALHAILTTMGGVTLRTTKQP